VPPDCRAAPALLVRLTFDLGPGFAARDTNRMPQRGQAPGTDEITPACIGQAKLFRDCALTESAGAFGKSSKAAIRRIPKVRNIL
jgi:hypothetical protein